MKTYLVGGAVRDQLLGIPHHEKDFVVVGATIEEMIELGFKPVGKAFPVFLHPDTHEEYALARTEKKISKGYKGFQFYTDPSITLEEDLKRRDLSINAIAKDDQGNIIDPFDGQADLKNHLLRHVSSAFVEDPVRILRIARFAAKFPNFAVAPETMHLMKEIVTAGETDELVSERVWQECSRALSEKKPSRFFEVLRECGALKVIFPEIDTLFGIPNPTHYHPEIDTGLHTLLVLDEAVKLTTNPVIRFAVLFHDAGKAMTDPNDWPKHHGHENKGIPIIRKICRRLHAPREYLELAILVAKYHSHCHKIFELTPQSILKLLKALDPFRRPDRFENFLIACQADFNGRKDYENRDYPQTIFLRAIYLACKDIDIKHIIQNLVGKQIEEAIHKQRLIVIKKISKSWITSISQ